MHVTIIAWESQVLGSRYKSWVMDFWYDRPDPEDEDEYEWFQWKDTRRT